MSLIYIHWTTVSTHGIEKWCEFHHILVKFVQLCINHLWHQEFHHILVVPPIMYFLLSSVCQVTVQSACHESKNLQEKNHQGGQESNTSWPAIPFHFLLLWKLRMAWEHNWTECFGDVRHLHHHRHHHHLYHNFSSCYNPTCEYIMGCRKMWKVKEYNSTRQKGCQQSQNGMLFHTWKTQKRFFISSAQTHRKKRGGGKKTDFVLCHVQTHSRGERERNGQAHRKWYQTKPKQAREKLLQVNSTLQEDYPGHCGKEPTLSSSLLAVTRHPKTSSSLLDASQLQLLLLLLKAHNFPLLSKVLLNPPPSLPPKQQHKSPQARHTLIHPPTHHPSIHPPIHPPVITHPLTHQKSSIHLPTSHPSTYLPTIHHPFNYPSSIHPPSQHPSTHPSTYPPTHHPSTNQGFFHTGYGMWCRFFQSSSPHLHI